jgi:L-threonylcarbamoyladenylate synthase
LHTEIIKIDMSVPDWDKQLDKAAEVLKSGGLVAFPTETVYGLGANALDEKAVKSIYKAKGRPSDNPLIVHISDINALEALVGSIPATAPRLMKAFWPGPLTLVFPKSDKIPSVITAGLDTVAIRMPSHPIALALIRKAGIPIAAPSANSSGRPSPTLAKHVIEDLAGKVDIIIDGGNSIVGLESTVLDIIPAQPVILRPGGVTQEQLRQLLGNVGMDPAITNGQSSAATPRSPGMKYRHYAPKAALLLFQGGNDSVVAEICRRAALYINEGTSVGILATDETKALYEPSMHLSSRMLSLGSRLKPEILASNLFRCLREFDEKAVEVILAEIPESDGIGLAVVNRLMKAAGGNIIKV